jgi:mitotic spindle assembly checkpoint protein MAD2
VVFSGGCSILYNRGVYPEESFARVKKYGLPMLLTQDEAVKTFITNLTSQLSGSSPIEISLAPHLVCSVIFLICVSPRTAAEWLEAGQLQRIVLVIMSKAAGEVLERWNFNIVTDVEVVEKGYVHRYAGRSL